MKQIDLFAGISGFGTGNTVLNCEMDPHCQAVLRYHNPDTPIIGDVRDVTKATVPFQPDIITAGVPCQDVSVAGKRAGLAGERTGLFFEFVRIVQEFQPPWIVFENVPGLQSSNERRDFATVIGKLGQCGYFLAYRILDSQYWGVAQRRRRVFIVGSLGNTGCVKVLFESEGLPWNPAKGKEKRKGLAPTIISRTKGGGGLGTDTDLDGGLIPDISGALDFGGHGGSYNGQDAYQGRLIAHSLPARGDSSEDGTGRGVPLIAFTHKDNGRDATEELSPTLRSMTPSSENVNQGVGGVAVCYENHAQDSRIKEHENITPTLHSKMGTGGGNVPLVKQVQWASGGGKVLNDTAQSLRSNAEKSYQFLQGNFGVRRLTPTECERLQGFEDGWTKYGRKEDSTIYEISDTQRYKQLGNAVSRSVGRWILSRIERGSNARP